MVVSSTTDIFHSNFRSVRSSTSNHITTASCWTTKVKMQVNAFQWFVFVTSPATNKSITHFIKKACGSKAVRDGLRRLVQLRIFTCIKIRVYANCVDFSVTIVQGRSNCFIHFNTEAVVVSSATNIAYGSLWRVRGDDIPRGCSAARCSTEKQVNIYTLWRFIFVTSPAFDKVKPYRIKISCSGVLVDALRRLW